MDVFSDLITALQSDLNVNDNSSIFPPATCKLALNRANIKCGRLFRWPQLSDAKVTSTQEDIENYDYPETWSPESIWRVEIDDEPFGVAPDFSPMAFQNYLDWKADSANANSTAKKWANHGNQYFVYPTPAAVGTNNISVWGQRNVVVLDDDDDLTIFSYRMPECNEAIVLEAAAILRFKGDSNQTGQMLSEQAKAILAIAYSKIKQEKAKYEKPSAFFTVPDYFSGKSSVKSIIGNFQ